VTGAGALDRRLVLEAPVEVADGAGGVVRHHEAVATLWAALIPLSGRAGIEAEANGATLTHRIVIRKGPAITTRHRFRLGARIFRIVSLREQDSRGRFVEIAAQERID
jgi:SPP1 family predicted phage head-tail adaptor